MVSTSTVRDDNLVQGNYVGTNATATGAVGNGEDGIWLDNASSNVIGGTVAGARNVVSGNNWSGIALSGTGATTSSRATTSA